MSQNVQFTKEMFTSGENRYLTERSRILTIEEASQLKNTICDHTLVDIDGKGWPRLMFFTNTHMFGHGLLPDDWVACSQSVPYDIAPRPGFESGEIANGAEHIRFVQHCGLERCSENRAGHGASLRHNA